MTLAQYLKTVEKNLVAGNATTLAPFSCYCHANPAHKYREVDQYLRTINPYGFQETVAALLWAMGYHVSWIAPPGKDRGVDIVAASDPLATRTPRIKVQVKRQSQSIDVRWAAFFQMEQLTSILPQKVRLKPQS